MPKPLLEWSQQAEDDLLEMIEKISDKSPQAAQELHDEIKAKVQVLPDNPKIYAHSQRAPAYRQLTVRANYLVFYRLLPSEDNPQIIDIADVVHARRKWP